jgi:hypothetical protein
MSNVVQVSFYVGTGKSGKHRAATNVSPFFCFEGDSEAEVIKLATEAFEFWAKNKGKAVRQHDTLTVETFQSTRLVSPGTRELVVA